MRGANEACSCVTLLELYSGVILTKRAKMNLTHLNFQKVSFSASLAPIDQFVWIGVVSLADVYLFGGLFFRSIYVLYTCSVVETPAFTCRSTTNCRSTVQCTQDGT